MTKGKGILNWIVENAVNLIKQVFSKARKYSTPVISYFQRSETLFLLLFANLVGIGAGFGAVLFRWLIASFQNIFFNQGQHILSFLGPYYVLIIPTVGGLIVGLLIYFFAAETKGHGVPEVMLAVMAGSGKIRPRVAAIKALVSSICIGSGGSVGREGPIVQIGSALGSTIGQVLKLNQDKIRILVACGAAGGIAATFNAPLAGIFFALEIILREYGTRYFSSVVLSAVTATVISRTFLGSSPAFIVPPYQLLSHWEFAFYLVLGFLAAFVGLLFIKVLYKCEDIFDAIKIPNYLKPAIGGLILGGIGLYFPQIFGVGYPSIENLFAGKLLPFLVFGLVGLKILATALTLGSGGSGGVFAPSLFIGAMLGSSFGSLLAMVFPELPISPGAYALVGMGAVFAGAAQAPISAILILFEMTDDYKIILPLMVTCVIATLVVKRISRDSIYTLKLRRRGIDISKKEEHDSLDKITVSEAMFRKVITIGESTTATEVMALIRSTTHRGFPVIDKYHRLSGIVTYFDIIQAMRRGEKDVKVKDIMTSDLVVCYPDETLKTVLEKLGSKDIGRIPVVERSDPRKLVGLITRKGIIHAYNQELHQMDGIPGA